MLPIDNSFAFSYAWFVSEHIVGFIHLSYFVCSANCMVFITNSCSHCNTRKCSTISTELESASPILTQLVKQFLYRRWVSHRQIRRNHLILLQKSSSKINLIKFLLFFCVSKESSRFFVAWSKNGAVRAVLLPKMTSNSIHCAKDPPNVRFPNSSTHVASRWGFRTSVTLLFTNINLKDETH